MPGVSRRVVVGLVAISPSVPALADAATNVVSNTSPVSASPLNLILGVIFLVLLVAATWWLLRRVNGLQWPAQRTSMRIIASLPLGQRERAVIIEIAGQQWLLGVTPGQVTLLHRFDEPVITTSGANDDFSNRMRQILQNGLGRS